MDALTRASFVAPVTSTIGLVPLVGTTYSEPFHVASQLASLDYASRGRAGWIAARSGDDVASIMGRPVAADPAREQRDSIEVARRLWDSWEDDAAVRNAATGRYLDAAQVHYVDFEGATFTVKGPAIVPRPPQGQVVVFGRDGDVDPSLLDAVLTDTDPNTDTDTRAGTERAHLVVRTLEVHLTDSASAGELVERIEALAPTVDGVRIVPTDLVRDTRILAQRVLPILFTIGLAHRPVPGTTLRGALGLSRPTNRFRTIDQGVTV